MKKNMAFLLVMLFILSLVACTPTPSDSVKSESDLGTVSEIMSGGTTSGDDQQSILGNGLFDVLIGENLTMNAINGEGKQLVNNSGMSGLWSSNHLHAAFDGSTKTGKGYIDECMYVMDEAGKSIFFDLGSVQALGQMCIWNYADKSDLTSGVKDLDVYYSETTSDIKFFNTFTIAMADLNDAETHGGCIASNINGTGLPIDFNGLSARYIILVPKTNWGGNKYGLSEVRVFRHKKRPTEGDIIQPESFTPRVETNAENVTNNSGINIINATVDSNEAVDNIAEHMWLSQYSASESLLILNLDGTYPLNSIKIWNYNDASNLGAGIKEVEIFYTTAEACNIKTSQTEQDYYDFETKSWIRLGKYTIAKGTGEDALNASLMIDLDGIHAQHIKIKPVTNYNGTSNGFGLSEVRVYASSGWAIEPSRLWSGILNTSGSFSYQGNTSMDPFATNNQGSGWLGGDGIFSTSLNGAQLNGTINENSITLVTFQDSFVGNMGNYRKFTAAAGYSGSSGFSLGMKNMAYLFINGNVPDVRNIQFYTSLNNNKSSNHPLQNILPGSYWIGDSTVIGGKVYTTANKFSGLASVGRDLYVQNITEEGILDMDNVASIQIEAIDQSLPNNTSYEPLYEEGDYIYQYGRKNNKLIVRRIKNDDYVTYTDWRYWNGSDWIDNINGAKTISEASIGNEFNVTYMQTGAFAGKYIAVYTEGSIWGTVTCCISDNITGPFRSLKEYCGVNSLFWATERYEMGMNGYKESSNYYVQWNYNAKSQPALSAENELLITYHFGLHDDRVPSWGFFSALGKEYEEPTFINLIVINERKV